MTGGEAIYKTIKLWEGMQATYGDNPTTEERVAYKIDHADGVLNCCHLCDFAFIESGFDNWFCRHCPVKHWPYKGRCGCEPIDEDDNLIDWRCSPISDILALLRKELAAIDENMA